MPKVLIVEDDKPLSRAIGVGLEKEGIESTVANDGEAALAAVDQEQFDLILLDLLMPNMSGFRFLDALGEKEEEIPVIVSTNSQEMQHKYKAKRYGVVKYLVKAETPMWLLIKNIKEFLGIPID